MPLSTEVTGVSKGKIELAQPYRGLACALLDSNAPEKASLSGAGWWMKRGFQEHWNGPIIHWGHSPNSVWTNKQEVQIGQNKTIPDQISQRFHVLCEFCQN